MSGKNHEVATLGGGCFWCLESVFEQLRGVVSVVSGYCGGHVAAPTYRMVCGGATGHAEVVQLVFDPLAISANAVSAVTTSIKEVAEQTNLRFPDPALKPTGTFSVSYTRV